VSFTEPTQPSPSWLCIEQKGADPAIALASSASLARLTIFVAAMSLSIDQQARAAEAYVRQYLNSTDDGASILADKDFNNRLKTNFITIFAIYAELYGYRFDCLDSFAELIRMCGTSWLQRDQELQELDKEREIDPEWFMSNKMLGGVCYVDRYATNLDGIRAKIPYFKELGLTYLHLMPLFSTPEPKSDGGYAVSSYRIVKPALGDMDQLRSLAKELRAVGISLVLDLVFNHTSWEHEWAKGAAAGDPEYSAYYWIFPDRSVPQAFEQSTREIFP
jgi:amylosucrase